MKKRNLLYAALILTLVVVLNSCFDDHDLHIRINDDDDVYRMRANFDDDLTNKVQAVVNAHLRKHHSESLVYQFTDKEIRFDDGTNFYIKTGPGKLRIRIDRDENSAEGYESVLEMCDDIKEALSEEENNNWPENQ